jgi:hypothetical protein
MRHRAMMAVTYTRDSLEAGLEGAGKKDRTRACLQASRDGLIISAPFAASEISDLKDLVAAVGLEPTT